MLNGKISRSASPQKYQFKKEKGEGFKGLSRFFTSGKENII
jgi:hypothetical protein